MSSLLRYLVPFDLVTLQTGLRPDEVRDVLGDLVRTQTYVGQVRDDGFVLERMTAARNELLPMARARIAHAGTGSTVRVFFRPAWFPFVFATAWLGFALAWAAAGILEVIRTGSADGLVLRLIPPLIGLTLLWLGFTSEVGRAETILRRLLPPSEPPPPRQPPYR